MDELMEYAKSILPTDTHDGIKPEYIKLPAYDEYGRVIGYASMEGVAYKDRDNHLVIIAKE